MVVGAGFHTVPEDQRWSRLEPGLRGVPWDIGKYVNPRPEEQQQPQQRGGEGRRLPPVVLVAPAPEPGGEVSVERPEEHQGVEAPEADGPLAKGRAWPARRTMMQKYGSAPGCQGCHTINMREKLREGRRRDQRRWKRMMRRGQRLSRQVQAEAPMQEREQGARDIEDVLRDMEEDVNGQAGPRRMEAEEVLAEAGSKEAASVVASIGALDVLEVFSPQRVTKELKRFGMRDGAAVDLEEVNPDGSERWNLDRPEDQKEVLEMIQAEEPSLALDKLTAVHYVQPVEERVQWQEGPGRGARGGGAW